MSGQGPSRPQSIRPRTSPQLWDTLADLAPKAAIYEFVDNSIDHFYNSSLTDSLTVDINWVPPEEDEQGDGYLEVHDDAGGVKAVEDELHVLISLGYTQNKAAKSVGYAGVGMKRAAFRLANDIEVITRHVNDDVGVGFQINREDFVSQDDVPDIPLEEYPEIEAGTTTIRLRDLRVNYNEALGGDEELRADLGETYELYLSEKGEMPQAYERPITIKVNGEAAEPQTEFEFSYCRFDELHPRLYTNFTLEHESRQAPVRASILVGLLRDSGSNESGTHIYCNGRKVLSGDQTDKGGYGGPDYLRRFNDAEHGRLVVAVYFESTEEGEASDLPWRSDKSDIEEGDVLLQKFYRKQFKRYVRPYMYATYAKVPKEFHLPFPADSPHASNNGELEIDSKGRDRNYNYPGDNPSGSRKWDYPEIDEFQHHTKIHAKLGISHPDALPEYGYYTYAGISPTDVQETSYLSDGDTMDGALGKAFGPYELFSLQEPEQINSGPERLSHEDLEELEEKVDTILFRLRWKAYLHAELQIQDTGLPEWQQSRYKEFLMAFYSGPVDELYEVDNPDLPVDYEAIQKKVDRSTIPWDSQEFRNIEDPIKLAGSNLVEDIQEKANKHATIGDGYTVTTIPEWEKPIYRATQQEVTAVEELEEVPELPEEPTTAEGGNSKEIGETGHEAQEGGVESKNGANDEQSGGATGGAGDTRESSSEDGESRGESSREEAIMQGVLDESEIDFGPYSGSDLDLINKFLKDDITEMDDDEATEALLEFFEALDANDLDTMIRNMLS